MSQPHLTSTSRDEDHATNSNTTSDTVLVPNSQTSDATSYSTHTVKSGPESVATTASQTSIANTVMSTKSSQSHSRSGLSQSTLEVSKPSDIHKSIPRSISPNTDSHVPEDSSVSSRSSRDSGSSTHGSKRTASGAVVKEVSTTGVAGIHGNVRNGHFERKSSTGSRSSKISELSLQLKTRLTYAMIKVQNGWEQRSIDEVESLAASQLSSPVSTTSTMLRGHIQSPRLAMATANSRNHDQRHPRDVYPQSNRYRSTSSSRPGTANSAWPQQSPRMYDQYSTLAPAIPTLAPAVELQPKSRHHRSDSRLSTATNRTMRATTPTPQEQDAVDTLLFMSSPANSSRFTHNPGNINSTQHSPSRGQFAVPRRNVPGLGTGPPTLYDRASASSEDEVLLSTSSSKRGVGNTAEMQRQAKRRSYGRLETEKDVDRLLDQMRDVVASGEEEAASLKRRGLSTVDVRM